MESSSHKNQSCLQLNVLPYFFSLKMYIKIKYFLFIMVICILSPMLGYLLINVASTKSPNNSKSSGFLRMEKQNDLIYEKLRVLSETDNFSKIKMTFVGECQRNIEKCSALACGVKEMEFQGKKGVIDLLVTPESYSKEAYKTGPDVWRDIDALTRDHIQLSKIVSGLQFSINTHIAAFHTRIFSFFISNPWIFQKKYKTEYKNNFAFLYTILRTATASLINNPSEISEDVLELSNEIIDYNMIILENRNKTIPNNATITFPSPNSSENINIDVIFIDPEVITIINRIIRSLSCLNCQKCRLWGTIQLKGLRSAVKALNNMPLTKMDVVYLINAFRRASVSVKESIRLERVRFAFLKLLFIYYYEICLTVTSVMMLSILLFRSRKHRIL